MIGKIAGRVDYKTTDHALIDVRGVGYIVFLSERALMALKPGEAASFYTEMIVREDAMTLYGFTSLVEKEWFRLLLAVQGVGAKAATAILGALGPDGVSRAIALGDWNAVKAAKGIGPKTAQRVVMELKDKAPTVMAMGAGTAPKAPLDEELVETYMPEPPVGSPVKAPANNAQPEALSALTNLGYQPGEAASAVATALNETPDLDTAGLIRAALKLLAPKG
ncbi:Holliday junction branch migration protein RuvA [Maritimibacter sp. DP1N21-5]|uniref:Holliday junction branch migration protein RuvA n=1 Tax=Maritimibacter sp. DP1N21-5 TaxID=2836867 RepID=UPI001C48855E|nr:Holliday junction branch migration protein RuvA [Maritimibacter sp. DP1N21-5]MBV7410248.1 Holliday junction branch migration protein RuvA [Maritimibacter sp. DP1N21-5]